MALGYTVDPALTHVSYIRYHEITQTPNTTPIDAAQVSLFFQCTQNNDIVQDPPDLRVGQWDGIVGGQWWDRGNGGQSAGFCADFINYSGFIPSAGGAITSFTGNKFALASFSGTNPLPVELLSFDAKPNRNIVDITWATASELNSDYFLVQRSTDGTIFEDVAQVNAAGNSSVTKKYSSSDYEPYNGTSYYRLKQVDNDGQYKFSKIVAENFQNANMITVYPNPTNGPFNVNIKANPGDEVLIVVSDLLGKEFYSKVIVISTDIEIIAIDPSEKLASGVYFVEATSNDTIYRKKMVIK